jgi:TolA-binding protein
MKHYSSALLSFLLVSSLWQDTCLAKASKKDKDESPSRTDHSAFFSENRQGIAPEKLREADQLRLQTVASIQKLLQAPNMQGNRKFELYLRLGEIYAERAEYLRDIEMKEYEQKYQTWTKAGKKGTEPSLSNKSSQSELLKSTEAFRKLVREFPKHPRTDAALYSLAKTLMLLENDNSVLYFNQLVQNHPQSTLLADTYLALGEHYFYKHDMEKAKSNYKAAIQFKDSKVYPFALYKLGWAYYNSKVSSEKDTLENINKSIAAFKLSIKIADKFKDSPSNFNLRQEAINDLIMVFAETERIDEAMDYFSSLGEKEAFYDMLERLGNIYDENGANAKAIEVYSRLLKESPNRIRNPEIHAKLVKLYESSLQPAMVVATLKTMKSLYTEPSSSWIIANSKNQDALSDATEKTRKNMHRYAALYHQDGQKLKKKPFLEAAAELYRLYLDTFPKTEEAYELRFYLADIYFNFEQYENAADEYFKVAQEKPKDGKYLKNASLNAVVSIRKIDEASTYEKTPALGQASQEIPLPRVKQKLIAMIDNYVKLLPQDPDRLPMQYTAAMTYFEYGHYKESLARFEVMGTDLPDTLQGKNSLKVILSYYSEKKDWENLVKKSRSFAENPKIAKSSMKEEVIKMLKLGVFQLATQQSKDGKFLEAAKNFESFQQQFPQDEDADKALYNASLNYYKVAKVEEALAAGNLLLKQYPKSKLASDVMLDMAQTNEALADFPAAAKLYRSYGLTYLKEPKARLALYNAATLYKGLKDFPESIQLFKKYIQFYPKDELSRTAHFEIAELSEKTKSFADAIQYYNAYSTLWPEKSEAFLIGRARVAKVLMESGNAREGNKEIRRIQRDLVSKGAPAALEARRIAAGALLNELEKEFKSFMEFKVTDAAKIEKEVGQKQDKLVELVKRYQDIIDLGSGEHTVASLYKMGEMHENFAAVLFDAPTPKNASQAEVDQFRSSVEKVAFPLRDEASKFFEAAYKRSQEVQTFTEWTRLSYEKMVELQPEKFPSVVEKSSSPSYMSHTMIWDNTISDIAN